MKQLAKIERTYHSTGLFGSGDVIPLWIAHSTDERDLGVVASEPATALLGFDVSYDLIAMLPTLWGIQRINDLWMAGYLTTFAGVPNSRVEWCYGATPDEAAQAAIAKARGE